MNHSEQQPYCSQHISANKLDTVSVLYLYCKIVQLQANTVQIAPIKQSALEKIVNVCCNHSSNSSNNLSTTHIDKLCKEQKHIQLLL
jgi:hypothetical protein